MAVREQQIRAIREALDRHEPSDNDGRAVHAVLALKPWLDTPPTRGAVGGAEPWTAMKPRPGGKPPVPVAVVSWAAYVALRGEVERLRATTERGAVDPCRDALRRIVWAENRGPDGAAESAYMVQVARDALAEPSTDRGSV